VQEPEFTAQVMMAITNIAAVLVITAVIYIIVMALFGRGMSRLEQGAGEMRLPHKRRAQRVVTALDMGRSVARWVIIFTGLVWVLASAGMDIRPVLAGAGVLGLAVGFGSQNLVRDIVSGFFILLEGQYAVGDYIRVGTTFGMVESIGVRVTVLKDLDNQRHYLPNGTIAAVTVYEEPFINLVVEVPVADAESCARARDVVAETVSRIQEKYPRQLVYHDPPEAVACETGGLVRQPVAIFPTQEWLVTEEIPTSIKEALTAAEIEVPETRAIRSYSDLGRMPQYRYRGEEGVVE
jgi:small conductance mechanosensitive channel